MAIRIEIFGTGCANCKQLERNAREAAKELGASIEVVKVEDFEAFIRRGITATPGMAIDGELVLLGRVPSVDEIIGMLTIPTSQAASPASAEIQVINQTCGCSTKGTMIFPCSGGSNVGQISNEAAKLLVGQGVGKFSCLAGIGAHSQGFIKSAKGAKTVLAIDGCGTRCAYKTLEHAGISPIFSFVVTEMGIKKDTSVLEPSHDDVKRVADHIKEKM